MVVPVCTARKQRCVFNFYDKTAMEPYVLIVVGQYFSWRDFILAEDATEHVPYEIIHFDLKPLGKYVRISIVRMKPIVEIYVRPKC